MFTKSDRIKCDYCGRWISYKALSEGKAYHYMDIPESQISNETWNSSCEKCQKQKDEDNN